MNRKAAEEATRLLAILDSNVRRPRMIHEPVHKRPASYSLCKLCGCQVLYANTPSGHRMPLDRASEGDLAVVEGTVREWGPVYADLPRFVRHVGEACREAQRARQSTAQPTVARLQGERDEARRAARLRGGA